MFLFVCFVVVVMLESGKIEHDLKISMIEVSLMDYGQSEGTQTWKKTVILDLVKKSGFLRILEKVKRVSDLTLSLSFGKTSYFIFRGFVFFFFF